MLPHSKETVDCTVAVISLLRYLCFCCKKSCPVLNFWFNFKSSFASWLVPLLDYSSHLVHHGPYFLETISCLWQPNCFKLTEKAVRRIISFHIYFVSLQFPSQYCTAREGVHGSDLEGGVCFSHHDFRSRCINDMTLSFSHFCSSWDLRKFSCLLLVFLFCC